MSDYTSLSDKKRDTIIDDLLMKFPTGPKGRLKKDDYTMSHRWVQSSDSYRDVAQPPDDNPYYGYDRETFARLLWACSKGNLRSYLNDRFTKVGRKAISRRFNRLDDRLRDPAQRWQRDNDGSAAIWSAKIPQVDVVLYVVSTGEPAAKMVAKTIAAGAGIVVKDVNDYYTGFRCTKVHPVDNVTMAFYREKSLSQVSKEMKSAHETISSYQKRAENLINLSVSLREFTAFQQENE